MPTSINSIALSTHDNHLNPSNNKSNFKIRPNEASLLLTRLKTKMRYKTSLRYMCSFRLRTTICINKDDLLEGSKTQTMDNQSYANQRLSQKSPKEAGLSSLGSQDPLGLDRGRLDPQRGRLSGAQTADDGLFGWKDP